MNPQELAAELLTIPDEPNRCIWLAAHRGDLTLALIQELKAQADGWLLRDTARAAQIADVALEAAAFAPDPLALAEARWARGNATIYLGEYEACLALYRQVIAAYTERGMTLEPVRLRANSVFALTNLGRYEEALAEAAIARGNLEPLGPTRFLATLEQNAGVAYRHLGRYEEALAAYARARAIFQALDDPVKAAEMDINRSKVLENLDDFRQAMGLLEAARSVCEMHGQAVTVTRVDLNLGTLLARQGRYREALAAYAQARLGFAGLGNRMEAAVVDLYRSGVYLALNLYAEAFDLATEARRELAGRGMARQVALAAINQAAARRGLGELAEAATLFDEARAIWLEAGAAVELALLDLERTSLLRTRGQPAEAVSLTEASLIVFEARGMAVRSAQARLLLADCHAALGRPVEAERLYRLVLDSAAGQELAALAYRGHFGLGRLAETVGQREAGLAHYRQAVAAIEALSRDLRADEFRAAFLDNKQEVYQALVRVLLDGGRLEEAFAVAEQAKAGVLLDFLAASLELQGLGADEREAGLWQRLQALREEWQWHFGRLAGDLDSEGDPARGIRAENTQALRRIEATTRETWWELQMGRGATRSHGYRREVSLRRLTVSRCQARPESVEGPTSRRLLRFQPPYGGIPEIQRSLPADTLLLEYFTLGQQIVAFLVSRQEVRVVSDFPRPLREIERSLGILDLTLRNMN